MKTKEVYSWNDLYDRAIDMPCGSPELKAKDNARDQVKYFALERDYKNPDRFECPEDIIEDYCKMWDIFFDENGNIVESNFENEVRKIVKALVNPYVWGRHDVIEMISFRIGESRFSHDYENDCELNADFDEVVVITEKRWLLDFIRETEFLPENTDEEAMKFLREQYTYEESEVWFDKAREEGKIIAVDFV